MLKIKHNSTGAEVGPFYWILLMSGCQTVDASNKVNLDNGYRAGCKGLRSGAGMPGLSSERSGRQRRGGGVASEGSLEGRAAATPDEGFANFAAAREAYQQAFTAKPGKQLIGLVHSGLGNTNYWLEDFDAAARNWALAYEEVGMICQSIHSVPCRALRAAHGYFAGAISYFTMVQQQYPGTDAANRAKEKQGFKEFNVQVATFASVPTANGTIAQLQRDGFIVRKGVDNRGMTVVSVGPYPNYHRQTRIPVQSCGGQVSKCDHRSLSVLL